jgi:hypothetical protein
MTTLKQQLIARAKKWCRETGYAPTTLGLAVSKDPRLIARLEAGGKVSTDVYEAAMRYMDAHPASEAVKQSWTQKRADSHYALRRTGRRRKAA